ncbi:tetratricopeptide repeat protein [Undibacterium luofuense]|uniref:Tetratricopeptide repeat protein n=1 Tax=Undibacterium luofuense TaxID=2828733 RepID=A0A941DH83_9BURK|nr:tetratricopeptide repeat protein [Undibacterium luofuense]MBR7780693.1 tetratricopeptide repeat protein [Undibacterium luofuense]
MQPERPTPNDATALAALHTEAEALLSRQQWQAADVVYQQILSHSPQDAVALCNRAYSLEHLQQLPAAVEHYRHALQLMPEEARIASNLAAVLIRLGQWQQAEQACRHALENDAGCVSAWSNLGMVLACLRREVEAESCLETALLLDPQHRLAQFNLSYLYLRQARWQRAWPLYEQRPWLPDLPFDLPRWQRGDALHGKRILLVQEGGYGDVMHMLRYLNALRTLSGHDISLLCEPALQRLLTPLPALEAIYTSRSEPDPQAYDMWLPVLSLPAVFDTRSNAIPAAVPYLFADEEEAAYMAQQLPPRIAGLHRIGLVWQGNTAFHNDAERSLPVQTLPQLIQDTEAQWFSLQTGAAAAQADSLPALIRTDHLLHDFAATAAVLRQLDALVTVDTAVAHLAGATGIPCALLLPERMPDWRWLQHSSTTGWYPHTRLCRQQSAGDWDSALKQAAQWLQTL